MVHLDRTLTPTLSVLQGLFRDNIRYKRGKNRKMSKCYWLKELVTRTHATYLAPKCNTFETFYIPLHIFFYLFNPLFGIVDYKIA